ncbi:MAG: hypothetical protein K9N34_06480 [Candidatus Marinimicrobia bacterium]|nr:hypothetical protein [Candidatus Neomarinimicrobiota bacterium]MCF7840489.1 hypothetical protein [Candidatus Neomarinimicrobiota bacterium]
MPEKKTKSAPEPKEKDVINFENEESRYEFLKAHLGSLMDGINDQYGTEIMEELLKRLEHTVDDFNRQLSGLLDQLQGGKMRDYLEGDVAADEFILNPNGDTPESEEPVAQEEEAPPDTEDNEIIKRLEARLRGRKSKR